MGCSSSKNALRSIVVTLALQWKCTSASWLDLEPADKGAKLAPPPPPKEWETYIPCGEVEAVCRFVPVTKHYEKVPWQGIIEDESQIPEWLPDSIVGEKLRLPTIPKKLRKKFRKRLGFKTVPSSWEYNEVVERRGGTPTFMKYWREMYNLKVEGWPNPDNKDKHEVMGGFTPKSAKACIARYGSLSTEPILRRYLQWQSSRYPETIAKYFDYQERVLSDGYLSCKDKLLVDLWPKYFKAVKDKDTSKIRIEPVGDDVDFETLQIPQSERYRVRPNPFPKMLSDELIPIIIWELSLNTPDADECKMRSKMVEQKVLDGEIEIPGIYDVSKQFVASYVNISKSVGGLEHYHFLFKTALPESDGKSSEHDEKDGRRRLRRLLSE